MKYPQIINERATLTLMLMGASIARFGDGEWRCAVGGGCTSQAPDENLARELKQVLRAEGDHFIVGIPNVEGCPRAESWEKYTQPKFTDLLRKGPYHSSFITRPDNAPAIDTPDYWDMVRQLWRGQDIILVVGMAKDGSGPERKSITREMIEGEAKSVTVVIGPRQHAYAEIDRIEADIVSAAAQTSNPKTARVLLCLGTCATVLSWRLWKRGMHALDVGHIGMFLRHAGAYRYGADDVVSPKYRALLEKNMRKRAGETMERLMRMRCASSSSDSSQKPFWITGAVRTRWPQHLRRFACLDTTLGSRNARRCQNRATWWFAPMCWSTSSPKKFRLSSITSIG